MMSGEKRQGCVVDGCPRPATRPRGYCHTHYKRALVWGDARVDIPVSRQLKSGTRGSCAVSSCRRSATSRGWCDSHYDRWRKHGHAGDTPINGRQARPKGTPCSVTGCGRPVEARGLCNAHYLRWRKHGTVDAGRAIRDDDASIPYEAVCECDGCAARVYAKERCRAHYDRMRRRGV